VNVGANQVLFVLRNTESVANSSISEAYFQDGHLLGLSQIFQPAANSFDPGANPNNLPAGQSLTPEFQVNSPGADFSADAQGNPSLGVDFDGDFVALLFDLLGGSDYDDVIAAINQGFNDPSAVWEDNGVDHVPNGPLGLRIGIHVRSIGSGGQSDSFVNTGNGASVVPEPHTFLGALIAGIPLGFIALRRRRATAE
jgi:hypothetical protein